MADRPVSGLDGERLKQLRGGTTQVDLEFAMRQKYGRGLSRATIQNYEAGRSQPKAPDVALLADFFDVSTDYLLGLTDDPTPAPPRAEEEPSSAEFLARISEAEAQAPEAQADDPPSAPAPGPRSRPRPAGKRTP